MPPARRGIERTFARGAAVVNELQQWTYLWRAVPRALAEKGRSAHGLLVLAGG